MDSIIYIVSNNYIAPIAAATILWDISINYLRKEKRFLFDETINSLLVNMHFTVVMLFCVAFFTFFWNLVSQNFSLAFFFNGSAFNPNSLLNYAICWVLADFCYYVYHRSAHENAFLWSMHKFHHQIQQLNTVSAQRNLPILLVFELFIFYTPLALLGFQGEMILVSWAISSFFQLWIHSNIGKIPYFEEVFNTPSHHRVHHFRGNDRSIFDKNYGASLMIWDRLFGTFLRENKKIDTFGLQKEPIKNWGLIEGNFGFIKENIVQLKKLTSTKDRLLMFIKPPTWKRVYTENPHWTPFVVSVNSKKKVVINLLGLAILTGAYNTFFPELNLSAAITLGIIIFVWGVYISNLLRNKT